MIHYTIEQVMKDAEESWKEHDEKNGYNETFSEKRAYKNAYLLGWVKSSYQRMYNDLPAEMKQSTNEPVNS